MGHSEASIHEADRFLATFRTAGNYMRDASKQLLIVAGLATDPKVSKRYRSLQKKMVKLTREWNRLEELREAHSEADVIERTY
jgi:MoxR-like ATPase